MTLKKSNLGIHDASRHLNREIDSQLGQKIFDLGIHDVSKHLNQEIDSRLDQIIFNLGIRNVDRQHKAIGASVIKEKVY